MAFKRDNHLDTWSSVKQNTPWHSVLVYSVSRSNDVFRGDYPLLKMGSCVFQCDILHQLLAK